MKIAPKTTELLLQRAEYIPGSTPLFELRPPALAEWEWALKRGFDLAVSSLIVVAGSPLWLAIAAAIKLTSRGPVFYRDRRIGLGEQPFGMMKFRTMFADAAQRQAGLEADNEASGPLFKIKNDRARHARGAFLRRFSLDELPQVLNVLAGVMSLVGPRPLRCATTSSCCRGIASATRPPGHDRAVAGVRTDRPELRRPRALDFYYIENWSIFLDITILARTLPASLRAAARTRKREPGPVARCARSRCAPPRVRHTCRARLACAGVAAVPDDALRSRRPVSHRDHPQNVSARRLDDDLDVGVTDQVEADAPRAGRRAEKSERIVDREAAVVRRSTSEVVGGGDVPVVHALGCGNRRGIDSVHDTL